MNGDKTSISKANTYQKIGEYWDTHDLGEIWDKTQPASFDVDIQSEFRYFPVELKISQKIAEIAKKRGISSKTLVNLFLQEKVLQ